ncbi:hypothetical protein SAMN06297144_0614 [Sphingomonas guangdongensis]|uniref:Uncharacterized protein n=1 Tax=Sphingomonas guangdongensis TaxID=1141890 RepID=A0A285QCJ9_9SPHN|nr:hypothetical protein [Sphingomonas guangdongensis]SOB79556.1 hypothetical protein SAMN06297144_0614 [Sphingomonas guangdongensis]
MAARRTTTTDKPANATGRRTPAKRRPAPRKAKDQGHTSWSRVAAIGIGTTLIAGGAALLGIFANRRGWLATTGNAEHAAPDLALDAPRPGTNRAPDAFRPDPTAPVPESEREGLRPATGPAPTLVKGQADELRRVDAAPA